MVNSIMATEVLEKSEYVTFVRCLLKKRYLRKDGKIVESVEQMIRRVSDSIARAEAAYGAYLHDAWMTEDECESCPDFEEDEYASEDEDEKRCKHSIFRLSEDSDE